MIRTLSMFAGVLLVSASGLVADTRSDILALTGNARTKLVWVRWPWCQQDYTPIKAYESATALENEDNPFTQLMAFDTDDGAIRFIDSALGSHVVPRITRSGTHVIWIDEDDSATWIRDLACTAPKRKLLDKGDCWGVACGKNPSTGVEFLYFESGDEKTLYQADFKTDYTLDMTTKKIVYQNTSVYNDNSTVLSKFDRFKISLSENGSYIGCALPWPKCMMIATANKQIYSRRADGAFGCEPCIAPDNSYRFFHNRDDHQRLRMWDAALSETNWDVQLNVNVPLPGDSLSWITDCAAPRWTNNPRFLTNSFPLLGGFEVNWGTFDIFKMSAAQVQAENPSKAGFFCLGKFSADYHSVEQWVRVTDGDVRHREVSGDAWISPTASSDGPRDVSTPDQNVRIQVRGNVLTAVFAGRGEVTVLAPSGRILSHLTGVGSARCMLRHGAAGLLLVRVTQGDHVHSMTLQTGR